MFYVKLRGIILASFASALDAIEWVRTETGQDDYRLDIIGNRYLRTYPDGTVISTRTKE